ncbi:hypothetical protein NQZ68_004719 [Dissostichus eleginoides]|nr:hypothetical protein NQZ68_004719 [Dissostichus eleginoides]
MGALCLETPSRHSDCSRGDSYLPTGATLSNSNSSSSIWKSPSEWERGEREQCQGITFHKAKVTIIFTAIMC